MNKGGERWGERKGMGGVGEFLHFQKSQYHSMAYRVEQKYQNMLSWVTTDA